jgi:hypothetical protein
MHPASRLAGCWAQEALCARQRDELLLEGLIGEIKVASLPADVADDL